MKERSVGELLEKVEGGASTRLDRRQIGQPCAPRAAVLPLGDLEIQEQLSAGVAA